MLADRVAALASTYGNTTEAHAHANNMALARACGVDVVLLRGAPSREPAKPASRDVSEAARRLASFEGRVAALGPLTDVAHALAIGPCRWSEVVIVGGNLSSWGRFPPIWPMEFNLTAERRATRAVFEREVPLTIVPLDVARGLTVSEADLEPIPDAVGDLLRNGSARWFRRTRLRKFSARFPVWDLVAAMWLIEPTLFESRELRARATRIGRVDWTKGRPVRAITSFDCAAVWRRFLETTNNDVRRQY